MPVREKPASRMDVLIADDDDDTRFLLRRLLESRGYTCAEAADGLQALRLAQAAPSRCLLLDLGMPGLDGLAVAHRLRADTRTHGIHIHCLTGRTAPEAAEEARRAGCEAFLTKPVDADALLEVVGRQTEGPSGGWLTGLTLTEARDLLDWLENQGCTDLESTYREGEGFAVRCTCPPGLRLGRDASDRADLFAE
jgi:CheY-like chemotaxis protein